MDRIDSYSVGECRLVSPWGWLGNVILDDNSDGVVRYDDCDDLLLERANLLSRAESEFFLYLLCSICMRRERK
jgi:hypothetical protein